MHGSQYMTNQFDARIPVRGLHINLKKMLVAKFFSSSTRWRSRNSLVTKLYGVQTQQLLEEKDELGHMSPIHNMLVKNFCVEVHQLWWPLKQSLYMFRVVRKESPNIYTRIGWKSNFLKSRIVQRTEEEWGLRFLRSDRISTEAKLWCII